MREPRSAPLIASALLALAQPACSIKKLAVSSLGNALAEGGKTYASDDDPDLVREAVPFGLKTVEALLDESPRHKGLLLAAASGFTQYGFAFIQQEADFVEARDLARATALRDRARKHYRRGLEYGLRGIEVDFPGFRGALRKDAVAALARQEFESMLRRALAVDPDAVPEVRVANLVAQRRARWLLGRADELFVE